jgi:hypothetical protein
VGLKEPDLDPENAGPRDVGAKRGLESGKQILHERFITVGLFEHAHAQQNMGVVCHIQCVRPTLAGTGIWVMCLNGLLDCGEKTGRIQRDLRGITKVSLWHMHLLEQALERDPAIPPNH